MTDYQAAYFAERKQRLALERQLEEFSRRGMEKVGIQEAVQITGLREKTLRDLIYHREIPYGKTRGKVVFRVADLIRMTEWYPTREEILNGE